MRVKERPKPKMPKDEDHADKCDIVAEQLQCQGSMAQLSFCKYSVAKKKKRKKSSPSDLTVHLSIFDGTSPVGALLVDWHRLQVNFR